MTFWTWKKFKDYNFLLPRWFLGLGKKLTLDLEKTFQSFKIFVAQMPFELEKKLMTIDCLDVKKISEIPIFFHEIAFWKFLDRGNFINSLNPKNFKVDWETRKTDDFVELENFRESLTTCDFFKLKNFHNVKLIGNFGQSNMWRLSQKNLGKINFGAKFSIFNLPFPFPNMNLRSIPVSNSSNNYEKRWKVKNQKQIVEK